MKYTIKITGGCPELCRDGLYVASLSQATEQERAAILAGLNGPSAAKAKRVAELRQLAEMAKVLADNYADVNGSIAEIMARDLESQADYLEQT